MDTQYHHYIPQFILKRFNIKENKLQISDTKRKYSVQDLYKDINNYDIMEIEKELGKLENKCSIITNNILTLRDLKISRKDLYELRKILFIMVYRTKTRKSQYTEEIFDEETKNMLDKFMNKNNINKYENVWLNNIK